MVSNKRKSVRVSKKRLSKKVQSLQKSRCMSGGKSNRYIEPQIYPKNLADGIVGKGKDKKFWQIKNGAWVKPPGIAQSALKKIYFMQLKKNAEVKAKKMISRSRRTSSQKMISRSRRISSKKND
jgi:hypothetical protein